MARKYPPINSHLLNHMILEEFKSKADFARHIDKPVNNVYNWCLGLCSPPVEMVVKIAKALNTTPDIFYIAGEDYVQMGIESALTRWAYYQQTGQADLLNATEAHTFIKLKSPDKLEDIFEETRVDPIAVPS